jgi:ABC-type transporter Mla maintaining outer membrane lipid asymmetry permease subunit MlaE
VGRSTTQAMVAATITIFITDAMITEFFVSQGAG